MLNGIDISHWQQTLDLSKIDCDFVICKATQGAAFNDSYMTKFMAQAIKLNKLTGVYHFMNGTEIEVQAENFLKAVEPYIGTSILVLDYEGDAIKKHGTSGAQKWLEYVYNKTKVRPLIYMSASVINNSFIDIAKNYGLWVAKYPSKNKIYNGYSVPSKIAVKPWTVTAIRQYTSLGKLDGYHSSLDLDIAYMSREAWGKYARGDRNG